MARLYRRRGPDADFELTAVFQTIPGLSVAALFDEGEILVLGRLRVTNGTGGTISLTTRIQYDGVDQPPVSYAGQIGAGGSEGYTDCAVVQNAGGQHTLRLQAQGDAAAGDVVLANSAELTVIQLPVWSPESFLS